MNMLCRRKLPVVNSYFLFARGCVVSSKWLPYLCTIPFFGHLFRIPNQVYDIYFILLVDHRSVCLLSSVLVGMYWIAIFKIRPEPDSTGYQMNYPAEPEPEPDIW